MMAEVGDVRVLVLRRDEADLLPDETVALQNAFPDRHLDFHRTDPRDYIEHDVQCVELDPAFVMLPRDKPIPSKAMARGVPHVTVIDGKLMRLVRLEPVFEPFVP